MATRRPASPAPRRPVRAGRLLACLFLAPGPACAQYMALTPPPEPSRAAAPEARKPAPVQARPAAQDAGGTLPNQRTGLAHPRVVRDICVGCDR